MRIEDYGLIGDLQAAARVGRIGPAGEVSSGSRRYRPGTLALESDFETPDGTAEEYDVTRQRQVGNFPQAFSHLTLIVAAPAISAAEEAARRD